MKTLMFYSYKGGSGRTVAAANTAAALAKLGKRVAIIDLDFEAPGLQHVLGADDTEQYKNAIGIQHYIRGEIELHELFSQVAIDTFGKGGPLVAFEVPSEAMLIFIMASHRVAQINIEDPQVKTRMRMLLKGLQTKFGIEYLIIDAASGVRDSYSLAVDVSDEMLIFFRWSTQHVEGTMKMARLMRLLKDYDQSSMPFRLIASVAPRDSELESLADEKLRNRLSQIRQSAEAKIVQTLQDCEVTPATVFHEIPEMLELKWRETVIVFGEKVSPYEALARKLLDADEPAAE